MDSPSTTFFSKGCGESRPSSGLTRRHWFSAAALTLSAACGLRKVRGFPGYAVVATAGENAVALVDLSSFTLVRQIPLGASPSAVLPSLSNDRTFVLTPSTGSVHVLNRDFQRVATRQLASQLTQLRQRPNGQLAALSGPTRQLILADPRSLTPVHRFPLPADPSDMDISVDNSVAVSFGDSGVIALWTPDGGQHTAKLDGEAGLIRFRSDGKLLIVGRPRAHALTVVNVPDLQVLADLPLAMEPRNFCFSPDGGQLFVTGPGMDGIAIVFPYNTLEVEQTILSGPPPGAMGCAAQPFDLFVASGGASEVSVLDAENRKVIGIVGVGALPNYITVTPDNNYALILDEGSGDVAVIRIPDIRRNHGKRNGVALFRLINVGEKPVHAAVIPSHAA